MSNPAEETPHDKDLEAADIIHETKEIPVETTQSNPVASGTQEIPVASTRAFLIMPNLGDPTQGMPAQRSLTQEIPAVKDPRQQDSPPKNVPSMIIPTVAEVQQYYQAQGQHATATHESVRTERNRKNSRVIQNSLLAMAALAAFFLGLVIFGYIISEPANPEKVTDIPVGTSLLPENSKNCGQGVYVGPDPSGKRFKLRVGSHRRQAVPDQSLGHHVVNIWSLRRVLRLRVLEGPRVHSLPLGDAQRCLHPE